MHDKQKTLNSIFVYTSTCCDKPAYKPPVIRSKEDIKENKFSQCGLSIWRCTRCEKKCKVKRSKLKKEEKPNAQQ